MRHPLQQADARNCNKVVAHTRSRYREAVRNGQGLHRANPVTGRRRSLRKIAAELAAAGYLTEAKYRGSKVARSFSQGTIKAMIKGPVPRSAAPGEDKEGWPPARFLRR